MNSLCAWRERTRRGDIRACMAHSRTSDMNSDATPSRGSSPSTVSRLPRSGARACSWSIFIKAHWGAIAATDLFTVEVVNPFGLVRYHVLFVIDIATRCVCIGGITSDPNGEWDEAGGKKPHGHVGWVPPWQAIPHPHRDPLFTEAVRGLLRDSGVKPVWSKYSNAQRVSSLHLSKGRLNPPLRSDMYSSSAEGVAMGLEYHAELHLRIRG